MSRGGSPWEAEVEGHRASCHLLPHGEMITF